MRVRFTRDVVFETEGRLRGPRFDAGSVHELREDLAQRWIRREVAVAEEAAGDPSHDPSPPPDGSSTAADPPAAATIPPAISDMTTGHGPSSRRRSAVSDPPKSRGTHDSIAADRADTGEQPGADDARHGEG